MEIQSKNLPDRILYSNVNSSGWSYYSIFPGYFLVVRPFHESSMICYVYAALRLWHTIRNSRELLCVKPRPANTLLSCLAALSENTRLLPSLFAGNWLYFTPFFFLLRLMGLISFLSRTSVTCKFISLELSFFISIPHVSLLSLGIRYSHFLCIPKADCTLSPCHRRQLPILIC